jgi:Mg2+-importing ATPase
MQALVGPTPSVAGPVPALADLADGGLSTDEARRRLAEAGPNDPAPNRGGTALRQLLPLVANPLAIILIAASVVSATLGELVNATIIVAMVVLGIAINVFQTHRSRVTVARLRSRVAPTATVLRDGQWCERPRAEIVPGDVVGLGAGDLVPADARLLTAKDLHVEEAALTGESLPQEKHAGEGDDGVVLLGTSIVSGVATAVVYATGAKTAFGGIATRVATRPQETEFERGTRRFGVLITKTVIVLVFVVVLLNVMLHRSYFESLLFAIALAVGLTPEFLPMISAVTLAQGAVHMAKHKVVVKHLAAMQNFGSIDILCSDKTGTSTPRVPSPRVRSSWRTSTAATRPASRARSTWRSSPTARRPNTGPTDTGSSTRSPSTSSAAGSRSASKKTAPRSSSPRVRRRTSSPSRRATKWNAASSRSTPSPARAAARPTSA